MKKIGTITFHWGANYGAVLQAYALQKYLLSIGEETELIRYEPRRVMLVHRILALRERNFKFFRKQRALNRFRKKELRFSDKTYHNNKQLHRCDAYDAVICGSDQIWNESFSSGAENKPTLSYFLDFVDEKTKKISYAASFGTEKLSDENRKRIEPLLHRFARLGIRENSGKRILDEMGLSGTVTVDPTLLLPRSAYEALIDGLEAAPAPEVFTYVLHKRQTTAQKIVHAVQRQFGVAEHDADELYVSMYEWLYRLSHAKAVVTNSFHGAVLSIIFHRPFLVVPVECAQMNDRIITLLSALGLEERIAGDDRDTAERLARPICWDDVDARLEQMRLQSAAFLEKAVKL